jgi:hypothetical protein
MDANAAHAHQLADFHGGLDIQLVRCIFENIQDDGVVVGAFRRGGEPQRKLRLEIGEHLLVGVGRGMMRLVDDEIVEITVPEPVQIQRDALNTAAHDVRVRLLDGVHIAPDGGLRPQGLEGLRRLLHELVGVCEEQRPAAAGLGIHDGGHGLAGTGGVIEQRDGLMPLPHGCEGCQRLFLMRFQMQIFRADGLPTLGGQVILDLLELRLIAEKNTQFVLDGVRLRLHLPHCPAVDVPAHMYHAVLLEQVVPELAGGHQLRVVRGFVVDLKRHAPRAVFQNEVREAAVLIDVVKRVLRIKISGFFRAKGIRE